MPPSESTDPSAEANLQATQAARQAAEAERDKAVQANTAAVAAKAAAEAERDKAVQANTAAVAAKAAAEAERDLATIAKVAADAARVAAEAERDQAAQAKGPAIEAKVAAETARDQANLANAAANAARVAADAEKEMVVQLNAAANIAKVAAESERDLATQANAAANAAKAAAEKERDLAVQANSAANAARIAAEADKDSAATAARLAETEASRAQQAHNLSTTAGLAGAFNQKAILSKGREEFWSLILVGSLFVAGLIGWIRFEDLSHFIEKNPEPSALFAQMMLSLIGIGAPVWMAWIATTMISKSFTINEDYSYKASLAQAYVGFKKEAQGMDPLLEQRLFAAAVTQLDANPVRFLDPRHPGSPLQDLLQQPFMQDILQNVTIKQHFVDWFNSRFKTSLSIAKKPD